MFLLSRLGFQVPSTIFNICAKHFFEFFYFCRNLLAVCLFEVFGAICKIAKI